MAKALLGHVATSVDRRLLDEVTRLRSRVRDLEEEVARLRAAADTDEVDLDHCPAPCSGEVTSARPVLHAVPMTMPGEPCI
jgi:hypothetical protein